MTKRQRRALRNMKVNVERLQLPVFFVDPKDSYVPGLLLIRTVFFRVSPDNLKNAVRLLFDLCRNEYLRHGRALTRAAIQELVTATSDLAHQIRLPNSSLEEVKQRLSDDVKWWNAWVDEEANVNLATRVVPSAITSQSGQPHWLDVELKKLGVTFNAFNKTYQGPESRTTRKLFRNESIEETSGIKIFKALKSAGSDIDRKTFDKWIAPQIKRPTSSRH